jgi:hypothetical protein
MFVTRDLRRQDAACARTAGVSAMAFAGPLAATAILGQIRQSTPNDLSTLEQMSSPGPKAEGSAFSTAHEPSAPHYSPLFAENSNPFRITLLRYPTEELLWNQTLAKTLGGGVSANGQRSSAPLPNTDGRRLSLCAAPARGLQPSQIHRVARYLLDGKP